MNSLVLYVNDLATMKQFYASLLDYQISEENDTFVRLSSATYDLVLHQSSAEYQDQISKPPTLREDCAWKPTFSVKSISASRVAAVDLGGAIVEESEQWVWGEYVYCNGNDPEGNVIQLRQLLK